MKLQVGMRVAVRWLDKEVYPAVIEKIDGDKVYLKFPNGEQHWLPAENVTASSSRRERSRVGGQRYFHGPAERAS